MVQSKGVSNGQDPLAYPQLFRVTHGGRRECFSCIDLEHCQVCFGITAYDLSIIFFLVKKGYGQFCSPFNHMIIGQDVAVFAEDDTGSSPLSRPVFTMRHLPEKMFEKIAKRFMRHIGILKMPYFFNFACLDVYNRGAQFFCKIGK